MKKFFEFAGLSVLLMFLITGVILMHKVFRLSPEQPLDESTLTLLGFCILFGLLVVVDLFFKDNLGGIKYITRREMFRINQCNKAAQSAMPNVKTVVIQLLHQWAMPTHATSGSNGYDCYLSVEHFNASLITDHKAAYNNDFKVFEDTVTIYPQGKIIVPLGFKMMLPPWMSARIISKSGIALKTDIIIPNAPGLVDTDYRGEVCVILKNISNDAIVIIDKKAICQMTFEIHPIVLFKEGEVNSDTDRGEKGHGHSGSGVTTIADVRDIIQDLSDKADDIIETCCNPPVINSSTEHMYNIGADIIAEPSKKLSEEPNITIDGRTILSVGGEILTNKTVIATVKGKSEKAAIENLEEVVTVVDPNNNPVKGIVIKKSTTVFDQQTQHPCDECNLTYKELKDCIKTHPSCNCVAKTRLIKSQVK